MVISTADIRRIDIQRRRRSLKNLVSYSRMIETRHAVRNIAVARQRIRVVVECIVTGYNRRTRLSISMGLFNARAYALIKDKGSEISILVPS